MIVMLLSLVLVVVTSFHMPFGELVVGIFDYEINRIEPAE